MEKIDNFLNHVYGSSQSLLYFYIALGAIALFFIVLILIILFTAEDASRKRYLKKEKQKESENVIKPSEEIIKSNKKEEREETPVKVEKSLSETQVFNNILMSKENENLEVKNEIIEPEVKEEKVVNISEDKIFEEPKTIKTVFDNDFYLEKAVEPIEEKVENVYSIPEVDSESQSIEVEPEIEKSNYDKPIFEDYTIEMPKVKPMDLDDYLFRREQEKQENVAVKEEIPEIEKTNLEYNEIKEEPKTEEVKKEEPVKVELSNDELKNRLAKLKAKKEEKKDEIPDSDLEDLMKAVGLEETTIIPKLKDEEKQVLGH